MEAAISFIADFHNLNLYVTNYSVLFSKGYGNTGNRM